MRRKAPVAAIGVLVLLGLGWLSRPHVTEKWSSAIGSDSQSSYISKGPQAEDKVVVMAKMATDNVDWVAEKLQDWQQAIYSMDDHKQILHPPVNKGREAMAYLTFIIDHYSSLPEIIVFLHPHRSGYPEAWHTDAEDYDNVNSIRSLRLNYVREHGYANMRCIHIPGCPDEIHPFRNDPERKYELAFADAYTYMFGGNRSTVPETVAAACCAQFATSRSQIQVRPKSEYERYRKWLMDTELSSEDSGRVLEYMWHMIFGKDPVWCPELTQCWCQQFGRCGQGLDQVYTHHLS